MRKSVVLVFHKEENGPLFEEIICALRKRYTLVSATQLAELILQKKEPENICHISFDDGEQSFYDIVFPLLVKYNIPASLFVSPEIISSGNNYWFQETAGFNKGVLKKIIAMKLDIEADRIRRFSCQSILKCLTVQKIDEIISTYWQTENCKRLPSQNINVDQLKEMDNSGLVMIGAHTISHPILKNETDEVSYNEISDSIEKLKAILGHTVAFFAYPNGRPGIDFGQREVKYLKEQNIKLAFSAELDHVSSTTNPLSVPRMSFARMGLPPSNSLVAIRMDLGKRWIDIKSLGRPSENVIRRQIKEELGSSLFF